MVIISSFRRPVPYQRCNGYMRQFVEAQVSSVDYICYRLIWCFDYGRSKPRQIYSTATIFKRIRVISESLGAAIHYG